MAADYLAMQKQLDDMRNIKADLEEKLRQSETQMDELASKSDNEQVKKFVQQQKERVNKNINFSLKIFKLLPWFLRVKGNHFKILTDEMSFSYSETCI